MAITRDDQIHLPPLGTNLTLDGDPVASLWAFDGPRALNNLADRIDAWPYVLVPVRADTPGRRRVTINDNNVTTAREFFMAQAPVKLQRDRKRLAFTYGVKLFGHNGRNARVTAASLYLASRPYTGKDADPSAGGTSFEVAKLAPGYVVRAAPLALATTSTAGVYTLVDDTATGISPPYPLGVEETPNGDLMAWLIATLTGYTDGIAGDVMHLEMHDVTAVAIPS